MAKDQNQEQEGQVEPTYLFRDAPEEREGRLAFEFEGLAKTLASLALNPKNETPFTVVVRGDWGRGKTTLLKRAQAILEAGGSSNGEHREVKTIWLNAWKYPQEDLLLAGLLGELIATMKKGSLSDQLKLLVDRHKEWLVRTSLGMAVEPFLSRRLLGKASLLKLRPADRFQEVEEKRAFYDHFGELFGELSYVWFHGWDSIRDNFGKRLDGSQDVVAVFLDDLDRCRRERVLEVLEAINLFLDQPGVCFYLGLDWKSLLKIVEKAEMADPEAFLEKIVQVQFDLPRISEEGAEDFLDRLLVDTPLSATLDGQTRKVIARTLTSRHPRHVKRFLNDLSIRIGVLRNTRHLGVGKDQVPEEAVVSWHLLLESLSPQRRDLVLADAGNLEKFLQQCLASAPAEGKAAEKPEWVEEEVYRIAQREGLPEHARKIDALIGSRRNFLLHLGSPPKVETAKTPAGRRAKAGATVPPELEWIEIPEGSFKMGSVNGEKDEKPVHRVTLSPFEISKFPVTNAQYAVFVAEDPEKKPRFWDTTSPPPGTDDHPVVGVSWHDASAFCAWKSRTIKKNVRLPTEAQWEFAARGSEGREYPWGPDEPTPRHANFGGNVGSTTPVDTYPAGATPEGVFDLAGNVLEWCLDCYGPYREEEQNDPEGPPRGNRRVLRGGAFSYVSRHLRAAYRGNFPPENEGGNVGFRCVVVASGGQGK